MATSSPARPHGAGSARSAQLRVGELIRHALADMLTRGEVHDPVLEGHLITVPEVRMIADLRLATVYVMPLGGRDVEPVLEALERNKRYLRGEIAHRVNLKFAPDIRFRIDERFDEAERIEKLLRTPAVQRDLKARTANERRARAATPGPHGRATMATLEECTRSRLVAILRGGRDAPSSG